MKLSWKHSEQTISRAFVIGACIFICIICQGCTDTASPPTPTLQDIPLPPGAQQVTNSQRAGFGTTVDIVTFQVQDNPDAVYNFFGAEMTRPDRGWQYSEWDKPRTVFLFRDIHTGATYFVAITATETLNGDTEVEVAFYHLKY
jgi:hypothetical protein